RSPEADPKSPLLPDAARETTLPHPAQPQPNGLHTAQNARPTRPACPSRTRPQPTPTQSATIARAKPYAQPRTPAGQAPDPAQIPQPRTRPHPYPTTARSRTRPQTRASGKAAPPYP